MFWKIMVAVILIALSVGIIVERTLTNIQIREIAKIKDSNISGSIALKGTIVYASDNTFILDDGTGRAELATCPVSQRRIDLNIGDKVTVVGEILRHRSLTTRSDFVLSAHRILHGGKVIEIRSGPGKTPLPDRRAPSYINSRP